MYLGGSDQEAYSFRPAQLKSEQDHISTNKQGMIVQICTPIYTEGIGKQIEA
jgi:hypothetical protein